MKKLNIFMYVQYYYMFRIIKYFTLTVHITLYNYTYVYVCESGFEVIQNGVDLSYFCTVLSIYICNSIHLIFILNIISFIYE